MGEKRLGGHPSSEENTDPPPLEEGEIPPTQEEQEEEEDVVEIVTTTGDRDVVGPDPFTSESAQILIREIMGCNLELENLNKNINDVIQKYKNIIDVLAEFKTPPNPFVFCVLQCSKCLKDLSKSLIWRMHTVCQHVLSAIMGDQWMRFGGATPSSIIK
ncbi:hypothetical protein AB205_0050110 [Aquarana catesbeiana]|uniref:Uncharacterized protein n=1 Tax=Aquarana catesbeiana TaxID=8400 RepID=A0A2G9QIK5_AQUCT|nr:hypothetical protein AB205_0050110 [Aquarana catesbeiana]